MQAAILNNSSGSRSAWTRATFVAIPSHGSCTGEKVCTTMLDADKFNQRLTLYLSRSQFKCGHRGATPGP